MEVNVSNIKNNQYVLNIYILYINCILLSMDKCLLKLRTSENLRKCLLLSRNTCLPFHLFLVPSLLPSSSPSRCRSP